MALPFLRLYCAAAPVHDPETGAIIGVIDVTGPLSTMHPSTLALVSAAAQLAENQLKVSLALRDERLRLHNMRHLTALRAGALLNRNGRVIAAESCGPLPSNVDVERDSLWLPDGRQALLEPLAEGFLLRVIPAGATRHRLPLLTLPFLGVNEPKALMDGRELQLTLRHAGS